MGLGFAWWVVVPPLIWLGTVLRDHKIRIPAGTAILWGLGAWLLISLGVGLWDGSADPSGAAGALFSALVWVAAGMLFAVARYATRPQMLQFLRGLVFLVAVQGAVTVVAIALWPSPLDTIPLPANGALGGISSLAPWTTAGLAYPAYFGDLVVRSAGMMGAAAWTGGFAAMVMIVMLVNRRNLIVAGMRPLWWLVAFVLAGCSVYFSYSRLSLVLAVVVGGYYLFHAVATRVLPKGGALLATLATVVALLFAAIYLPWAAYIDEQDALRPGSSRTRMGSYNAAVHAVTSSGFGSLLGGLGDKPALDGAAFGVGSESTYFSLLVRGGLIAVTLLVAFLLLRLADAARAGDLGTTLVVLALAVHAVAADLDVGTLTLLTVFFTAGRLRGDERVWGRQRAARPPGIKRRPYKGFPAAQAVVLSEANPRAARAPRI